ncbi:MAG: 50S ribosomal protein L18 [Candidatus Jorgensenbacteria bacterium GW2011_GWA1_48_11]|uniref:Large ribosomal subunit protein uL18 n=1 Tax=Candidatus Jorgensenbacteria bacterium GW2011_GWA1_48_11 TaxID=1618660 RepID=A0A0G1WKI4_9BACT|nr:MAG: 50S ribosomal protein L18 [Candidatus Jorgensenbacteria bacterium GW2011_GWA1_48_11]KKW12371.1 MAG: 50S ribosomal protein L18 [Candidatus Jorgensenbacteria bacterium GW2011_GWB1_49_9]
MKKRIRRQNRVRAAIRGTAVKPRLSVFRSHRHIYAQLIDDGAHKTLASVSSKDLKEKAKKSDLAKKIGELVAAKAQKLNVKTAVLDRGRYQYHGRVKALADGARAGGLKL